MIKMLECKYERTEAIKFIMEEGLQEASNRVVDEEDEEDEEEFVTPIECAQAKLLKTTIKSLWQEVYAENACMKDSSVLRVLRKWIKTETAITLQESEWFPHRVDDLMFFFFRAVANHIDQDVEWRKTTRRPSSESVLHHLRLRDNLLMTTKYPALYPCLEDVAHVGKSHVECNERVRVMGRRG